MKKVFKNKKGFTLIELLAVIVILGVIMVIAVPAVTKYIDKSRKDGVESSAKMYVDAVNKMSSAGELTTENGSLAVKDLDVQLKSGQKPSNGWLDINDGIVERATLCIDKYSIKYENKNAKIVNDDYCNYEVTFEGNKTEVTGTTMVINKTLTTETNIMCTNGAVPSYSNGQIKVTHVNGKTSCGAYNSLREGVNATSNLGESNIVMINNETLDAPQIVLKNKKIQIDLNNKTITNINMAESANNVFFLSNNTELTLRNGKIDSTAGIDINSSNTILNLYDIDLSIGKAIWVRDTATLNMYDGTNIIIDDYSMGAINLYSVKDTTVGGVANIYGGTINSEKIAIENCHAGTVNIYNGKINGINHAIINLTSGIINIYGGEMTSSKNHTILNPQGSTGTINVMGGTINQTEVTEINGTAIYNYTGTLNIKGGTIVTDRNTSVYNREGIANITGGTITSKQYASLYHDSGTTHISGNVKMSALGSANINARGGNLYINGGLFESKYQNISTNIWQNYSGGNVYICGGSFNKTLDYHLKMSSVNTHLYYKSTNVKWNNALIPLIFPNEYITNVILDNTITCK